MKTKVNVLIDGKRRCGVVLENGTIKTSDGKIYKPTEIVEIKIFKKS